MILIMFIFLLQRYRHLKLDLIYQYKSYKAGGSWDKYDYVMINTVTWINRLIILLLVPFTELYGRQNVQHIWYIARTSDNVFLT